MSKIVNLDFNLLINKIVKEIVDMNNTGTDTGIVMVHIGNNNVLSVNLEFKELHNLQIPGLINVDSR